MNNFYSKFWDSIFALCIAIGYFWDVIETWINRRKKRSTGWKTHSSNYSPFPYDDERTTIRVLFRSGIEIECRVHEVSWTQMGTGSDVTAYKIISK